MSKFQNIINGETPLKNSFADYCLNHSATLSLIEKLHTIVIGFLCTPPETQTQTARCLNPLPLPIGLAGYF